MRGIVILAVAVGFALLGTSSAYSEEPIIPDWVKNNVRLWLDGQISNQELVNSIDYLNEKGIIRLSNITDEEITAQINYLKTKNDVIKEEVKQLRKENEDLKIMVKNHETINTEIPTSFSKFFEEHEMLQKEVKRLREVNNQFEEQVQSWINSNNFQEIGNANGPEKKIQQIESDYANQINNLKQENMNYKSEIEEFSQISKSYEKQVELLKTENENKKMLIEQLKIRNQENREELNQTVQQTDSLQDIINKLRNENDRQGEKVQEYQSQIVELRKDIEDNLGEKSQFEDLVSKIKSENSDNLKKISELNESNDQKNRYIEFLKDQIGKQNNEANSLIMQITAIETSLKELEEQNSEYRLKTAHIENENTAYKDKIKQLEAINNEQLKSLASVFSNAKESNEFVKNLNSQTQIYKDRIKELETQNSEYRSTITKLETQNDEKTSSLIELKNNIEKTISAINDLNSKVTFYENRVDDLEEQNNAYQAKIEKMESEISKSSEDTISYLKSENTSKDKEIFALKIKIDESESLVKSLNSKISEYQESIKSLEAERDGYKDKILSVKDDSIQPFKQSPDELDSAITSLKEENKEYLELVESIRKQNLELSNKINLIQDEKLDQQSIEVELKNQNKELQGQIEQLKHQISQKETEIQSSKPVAGFSNVKAVTAGSPSIKAEDIDFLKKQNEGYVVQLNYFKAKALVNEEELEILRNENEEFKTIINILKNEKGEPRGFSQLDYDKINESSAGVSIEGMNTIQDKIGTINVDKNKEHTIYINPIPDGLPDMRNEVTKSIEFWEKKSGIKFKISSSQNNADSVITWSKDLGNGYDGYIHDGKLVQIGLGSSECDSTWRAYSPESVRNIITHELGHLLGLSHSTQLDNIMYPRILEAKYDTFENNYILKSKEAVFVKTCSFKSEPSFEYQINVKDSKKIDFFFVPSIAEKSVYDSKKTFNYYSDLSCMGIGKTSQSNTCKNVTDSAGILIIAPEMKYGEIASVHVKISEK